MTSYRQLIDVAELREINDAGTCRIVDCRFDLRDPEKGRADYLEGHIPGAVYADLNNDLAGSVTEASGRHPLPDADDFKATLEALGIGPDTQVVVYDQASGALAARLWWLLRWFGHSRVAILNGGMTGWCAAGEALETSVPQYPPTSYNGSPGTTRVTTSDDIVAALGVSGRMHLVDARDPPRFAGLTEPLDAVAGHVPGALNLPFSENLNADGTWKSAEELRGAWERILGGATETPITVMCGSGVTACHLALSAEIAGIGETGLYVGSWSEWISDRSRPVATEAGTSA